VVDPLTAVDCIVTRGAVHPIYVVVTDVTERDVRATAACKKSAWVVPRSLIAAESP
jgi:hypothetical protein